MYYKPTSEERESQGFVFWSSSVAADSFPVLIREMEHRGYNLPDVQKALGCRTLAEAASSIAGRRDLRVLDAIRLRDRLFPDMTLDALFNSSSG